MTNLKWKTNYREHNQCKRNALTLAVTSFCALKICCKSFGASACVYEHYRLAQSVSLMKEFRNFGGMCILLSFCAE
jgi:hypothetical protein